MDSPMKVKLKVTCLVYLLYHVMVTFMLHSIEILTTDITLLTGKVPTVKFLIQSGACVDAQDVDGQTALHKAVANKNYGLTKILLEICPNLAQIKDTKGRIPTEAAAVQ